jgi:DNA modification methylase
MEARTARKKTSAPNGTIDPRNTLNELSGKEWIQETISVWRQRGLGASHPETKFERLHPAPFSFQDVARLIRFFTKEGMLVLDPFMGVASTLKAAALEGRRGLGIELSPHWAELGRQRLAEEVADASTQEIWTMDVRDAISCLEPASVDFIVTSPPYWSILNKRPDHKVLELRVADGLEQSYSDDVRDLGNLESYPDFIEKLSEIFIGLAEKLRPTKYCAIIVSDFKHGGRFYPFHSDLYSRLDGHGLELQGVTVLHQPNKSVYPYGYPFAYVPNIHHQYILLLRRPKNQTKQRAVKTRVRVQKDVDGALEQLAELPHKDNGMSARNWGHRRHSICSYPSKMKPALAATLVDLFTLPDSIVLDPFSGSGTVPFEAALRGRLAISNDLSPLAHVISSAKIRPPRASECDYVLTELTEAIGESARETELDTMELEIREYFHKRTARELVVARDFLATASDNFQRNDGALFVTACLAHILHGNRPYALSRRSHNIIPIPPTGPKEYKSLITGLRAKCDRVLGASLPDSFRVGQAYRGDASALALATASVDTVITSPPFLGSTHFLRQNRLRNWLLGWSYEEQQRRRNQFLEHQETLDVYTAVMKELHRVVRPGGLVVFHVGVVKDDDMAELLAPYFLAAGFAELGTVWEDTAGLESHGRSARGGTHTHGVVVLRRD